MIDNPLLGRRRRRYKPSLAMKIFLLMILAAQIAAILDLDFHEEGTHECSMGAGEHKQYVEC